jgi:Flp pilus assembly protein TadB
VTAALGFGAVAGIGLVLALSVVLPPRPSLVQALRALNPPAAPVVPRTAYQPGGWAARAGRPFVPLLGSLGLPRRGLAADLELCDRDPTRHAAEQATAAVAGLVAPPLVAAALWAGGVQVGWSLPLSASLVCAGVAAVFVDLQVRQDAARRRDELRNALAVQLDLTMMALAGGAGIDQAVTDAAEVGHGWAHQRLRHALQGARTARLPIWDTLADLGRRTRVPELAELAAAVNLAGQEGARIRATLAARAAALRARQLSDAEAVAASATERMALPSALLFIGFLLAILYPAVSAVWTSL